MRELEIFRKAYPQYNDMSDADLAQSLADKFPKAYSDLPVRLEKQEKAIRRNPNLYGAYGAAKALASTAVKPSMEAIGGVLGTTIPAMAGPPGAAVGSMTGGALGYGVGTKIGEMAERGVSKVGEWLGFEEAPEAKSVVDELISSGKDVSFALAFGKGFELAGKSAQMAETFLFDKLPQKLMASSVKMPLTKRWTKVLPGEEITRRQAATTEALKSKITPSEYGAQRIRNLEKEVRTYIDDFLNVKSTDPKAVLNRDELIETGLKKAYADAERSSDPVGAKAIVDDIAEKFKAHPEQIPVNEANKIKQQLYKETSWAGNEKTGMAGQITETGKKGISREIMVKLEGLYPELAELNATDSARIGLRDAIEKEVALQSQKNMVGLSSKVLLRPWIWPIAFWDATMGHPAVKSRLAIALSKANPSKYGKFEYPEMPEAYQNPAAGGTGPQPTGWTPPETTKIKATTGAGLKSVEGQAPPERTMFTPEQVSAGRKMPSANQIGIEDIAAQGRPKGPLQAEIPQLSRGINKILREDPELSTIIQNSIPGILTGKGESASAILRMERLNSFRKAKKLPSFTGNQMKEIKAYMRQKALEKINEFRVSKGLEPFNFGKNK